MWFFNVAGDYQMKWLRKILGIADCEKGIVCLHEDMQRAFNRIERIERTTRLGKRSMRHGEIERARKMRYKNWPKKGAA